MANTKHNPAKTVNPCYQESLNSLQCQEKVSDKELCRKEIDNYKTCREFWKKVSDLRRFYNIKPYLPEIEERKQIQEKLAKYKNFKIVFKELVDDIESSKK